MRNLIAIAAMLGITHGAQAGAPPTYKCVDGKKVTYSDEPCIGATAVDTTPTQGMSKLSGQTRKGQDVQRAETNAAYAKMLRPLLGETTTQYESRHRRANLSNSEKLECKNLDGRITTGANDEALYSDRKRYKDLKC